MLFCEFCIQEATINDDEERKRGEGGRIRTVHNQLVVQVLCFMLLAVVGYYFNCNKSVVYTGTLVQYCIHPGTRVHQVHVRECVMRDARLRDACVACVWSLAAFCCFLQITRE